MSVLVTQPAPDFTAAAVLPDGSIKYTPRPGFSGTDRITYVIADGNGGHAIASVTISVNDGGYSEKPQVFGFNGPENPQPAERTLTTSSYPGITVEGAVVDAVFDIGTLRSIAGQLGADGVVHELLQAAVFFF